MNRLTIILSTATITALAMLALRPVETPLIDSQALAASTPTASTPAAVERTDDTEFDSGRLFLAFDDRPDMRPERPAPRRRGGGPGMGGPGMGGPGEPGFGGLEGPWIEQLGRNRNLSDEDIDRVLELLAQLDADSADRMKTLRESDPERFQAVLRQSAPRVLGLLELDKRNPELAKLKIAELIIEARVIRLAGQYREARGSALAAPAAQLEDSLRSLVREQLDLSIRAKAQYILMLDEHVATLRERLRNEATNRDQAVERRMQRLIGNAENHDLGAEAPAPKPQPPPSPPPPTRGERNRQSAASQPVASPQ